MMRKYGVRLVFPARSYGRCLRSPRKRGSLSTASQRAWHCIKPPRAISSIHWSNTRLSDACGMDRTAGSFIFIPRQRASDYSCACRDRMQACWWTRCGVLTDIRWDDCAKVSQPWSVNCGRPRQMQPVRHYWANEPWHGHGRRGAIERLVRQLSAQVALGWTRGVTSQLSELGLLIFYVGSFGDAVTTHSPALYGGVVAGGHRPESHTDAHGARGEVAERIHYGAQGIHRRPCQFEGKIPSQGRF